MLKPWRLLLVVCLVTGLSGVRLSAVTEPTIIVGMQVLRDAAIAVVLPEYPLSSLRSKHQGRVVIDVLVGPTGHIIETHILEAPDEVLAASVTTAVQSWSFRPFNAKIKTQGFRSRLLFYFRIQDGKGVVVDGLKPSLTSSK